MAQANSPDRAAVAATEVTLAADRAHCPDWSSRPAAWYPGRSRRTALAVGLIGYGAIPAGLAMAGILGHSAVFGALAWAILLLTAACAPLLREPSSQPRRETDSPIR